MSITYTTLELQTLAKENYIGIYVGTLASLVFQGYVMSLVSLLSSSSSLLFTLPH